ncbi:extracellular solute-binding protein [Leifsonia sp. L25]|uniref:extracellular solute-binding protein n=1 Tax=Leifsonia sp. L25 TaxID=3423957 RepID=UPI003D691F14
MTNGLLSGTVSRRGLLAGTGGLAVLAALAACSSPGGTSTSTLKFWNMPWGGTAFSPLDKKITLAYKPASGLPAAGYQAVQWSNFTTTFASALASNTGPAVSSGAGTQAFQFAEKNYIAYADSLFDSWKSNGMLDDFLPGVLDTMKTRKGYVAVPYNLDMRVLWYRKSLLEKAGVEPPTDWQSYLDVCAALKKIGVFGFGIASGAQGNGFQVLTGLLINNGGGLFNADQKPDCVTPANIEALEFVVEMIRKGYMDPGSVSYSTTNAQSQWKAGTFGMGFESPGLAQVLGGPLVQGVPGRFQRGHDDREVAAHLQDLGRAGRRRAVRRRDPGRQHSGDEHVGAEPAVAEGHPQGVAADPAEDPDLAAEVADGHPIDTGVGPPRAPRRGGRGPGATRRAAARAAPELERAHARPLRDPGGPAAPPAQPVSRAVRGSAVPAQRRPGRRRHVRRPAELRDRADLPGVLARRLVHSRLHGRRRLRELDHRPRPGAAAADARTGERHPQGPAAAPWVVPIVVSSTSWNWLVATPQSPLPLVAKALGFGDVLFLADPLLAQITVCVFKVWISFPFMMMMMSSALASVDTTVYEASRVDGASRWKTFRFITLPMISRSTYISWILMTIFCVNDFPTIFLLTGGGPVNSTQTLVVLAYTTVFQNFQTGPGVAIAFLMTIVLVIVSVTLYRQIRKAAIE